MNVEKYLYVVPYTFGTLDETDYLQECLYEAKRRKVEVKFSPDALMFEENCLSRWCFSQMTIGGIFSHCRKVFSAVGTFFSSRKSFDRQKAQIKAVWVSNSEQFGELEREYNRILDSSDPEFALKMVYLGLLNLKL